MLKATTQRKTLSIAVLTLAMLGATTAAHADHDRGFRNQRDVDLDVGARLEFHHGHARLNVKIKAEIEGRFIPDQYNVILTIEPGHHGYDRRFVPSQTMIVPLGRPTDIDDDEVEFERRVNILLPRNLARFGDSLVVKAELVSVNSGRVIERESTFVDHARERFPRHPRRRGPGFGGRFIW